MANEDLPVHLCGIICWSPIHEYNERFLPRNLFRSLFLFSSELKTPQAWEVGISYSDEPAPEGLICNKVKLHFLNFVNVHGKEGLIEHIRNKSELILLDGPRVFAVVCNLTLPDSEDDTMSW